MRMTVQVTYIFIPIVSLKDSFCQSGKSKLGIGLFIHELLREPLIAYRLLLQVVLPTFILEPRSLLEMFADFFAHPDLFVK